MALLRALNVGGHIIKMARLRALFEEQGFSDVETVIASGNVLFTARATDPAKLESRIERHLHDSLGYEVATFLRSPDEMAAVIGHKPFPSVPPAPAGESLSVLFLKRPADPTAREALAALGSPTDEFHVFGREAYWWCHGRTSDSKVTTARLEKALAGPTTGRNITTVAKLAAAASA